MPEQTQRSVEKLEHGSHGSPDKGMCLLEAVAYVAGEPFSDKPQCVDVTLGAYGRVVNDWMTAEERQRLLPFIPKLIGTAGSPELSQRRAFALCDVTIRQILPRAFDATGLPEEATKLRNLPAVDSASAASAARSAARSAESAAWSAPSAARSAAWSAASAARSAAWSAESAAWSAPSAARSAAWSAESAESAESAAWSAARETIIEDVLSAFEAAIAVTEEK